MTLAQWLKKNRRSQEWFASQVDPDCTQSLVSKWVRGAVVPTRERRRAIEVLTSGQVTARGLALKAFRKTKRAKASP